jgi:hypothetical protein
VRAAGALASEAGAHALEPHPVRLRRVVHLNEPVPRVVLVEVLPVVGELATDANTRTSSSFGHFNRCRDCTISPATE